jgi:hypothetical protein
MSYLTDLQARRDVVAAEIAAIDATKAGGLPDGTGNVAHQAYKAGLYAELDRLKELIGEAESEEDGVVIVDTHGIL